MKYLQAIGISCKNMLTIFFAVLFFVVCFISFGTSFGANSKEPIAVDIDAGDSGELDENKKFIMDTFDAINENFVVQISGTSETSKTAEPELYNSMLSRGGDILPAVLGLLAEGGHGKRSGELYMLYKDIMESLGESALDYYGVTPPLPDDTPDDPDEISYVWWENVDPSVYIPEPENTDNPPDDYIRWEPMLGCYIYRNAYYNEELGMIVLERFPVGLQQYRITVSVQPKAAGSASASHEQAFGNEIVTLAQAASEGYRFKEWNVISPSEGLYIPTNRFIMPEEGVEIEAVFEPVEKP